jgi:uncharacterized membrane-anchored protein
MKEITYKDLQNKKRNLWIARIILGCFAIVVAIILLWILISIFAIIVPYLINLKT